MIKVRITTFARNDEDLYRRLLKRYNNGSKYWNNIEFVYGEEYDKLIVFTYPHQETIDKGYDEKKTITIKTEPSLSSYSRSHPTSRIIKEFIPLPFLSDTIKGYKQYGGNGERILKSKLFSSITSEMGSFPGHYNRLKFLYSLSHFFKEDLDIYGWKINGKYFDLLFKYDGYIEDKYEGLWNYKYNFACENSFEADYFTEKILDPIITETFCFYDGCPNIFEYIDERSFMKIDVKDIGRSMEEIVKKINDNGFENHLKFIRREKKRILEDFHPFKFISYLIEEKDLETLLKIQ